MSFFQGKVVIITGSSNGIGRGTARLFARQGAKLTITGRNAESLQVTKEECIAAGAKEEDIHEVLGDIANDETPRRLINETVERFGKLDVLVNNAGISIFDLSEDKSGINADISALDRTLSVNLRANAVIVQLAVPHLEKTQGAIVNVSSISSAPVVMNEIYYPVSKAALDQLTVQQAGQLIKKGIRVNGVNPGIVKTDILNKCGLPVEATDYLYEKWGTDANAVPIGRAGTPDDIAKLILFLADRSQSEFIVGQRIAIDGGSLIRNCLLSADLAKD